MAYLALGFKVDIAAFALPLLAFALHSSSQEKALVNQLVDLSLVLCFLFMGLQKLKGKRPRTSGESGDAGFPCRIIRIWDFFSIILFLFIGAILTMIVQASAATMAITLIMCANGWIDYHLGSRFGIRREYRNHDYGQLKPH